MEHATNMPYLLEEGQLDLFGSFELDVISTTYQSTPDQLTNEGITNDPSLNNDFSTWWDSQFETENLGTSLQSDFQPYEPWSFDDPFTFSSTFHAFDKFSNMEQSPTIHPESQSSTAILEHQLSSDILSVSGSSPSNGSDQVAISPQEESPTQAQQLAHQATDFPCRHRDCARSFTKKYLRTKHEQIHTKPITCPLAPTCQHRTAMKRDMRRHVAVHHADDNVLPQPAVPSFTCSVSGCRYERVGFKRKDHLTRHMKKVHSRLTP